MLQGLQQVLGALGGMMAAPDADIDFLTKLQHAITAKIREGTKQSVGGQPGGGGQPAPGAQPAGGAGGMQIAPGGGAGMSGFGQAPPPGMGAPGPGGMGAPNPNELGRVLQGNGQAQ